MLYECSCGFEASTATAFYKHLSANKDGSGSHQLVQGRPRSKGSPRGAPQQQQGQQSAADLPLSAYPAAASGRATWQGPATTTANPLASHRRAADEQPGVAPQAYQSAALGPLARGPESSPGAVNRQAAPQTNTASPSTTTQSAQRPGPAQGANTASPLQSRFQLGQQADTSPDHALAGRHASQTGLRHRGASHTQQDTSEATSGLQQGSLQAGTSGQGADLAGFEMAGAVGPGQVKLTLQRPSPRDRPQATQRASSSSGGAARNTRPADHAHTGDQTGYQGHSAGVASASGSSQLANVLWLIGGVGMAPLKALWAVATSAPAPPTHTDNTQPTLEQDTQSGDVILRGTPARGASDGGLNPFHPHTPSQDPITHSLILHSGVDYLCVSAPGPAAVRDAVRRMEALLLWEQPAYSARALLGGLYAILCMRSLAHGSSLLATSTAVLGMCFLALMINTTRMTVWRITQRRAQASHTQDTNDTDTCDITPVRGSNSSIREGHKGGTSAAAQRVLDEEARVFSMVHMLLSHCVVTLVPLIAGLVALVYRALSGRRLASTALTATCLWCGMLLGELRVINQSWFAAICWVTAFTVPYAYVRTRAIADSFVEDSLRLVVRLLVRSDKATLLAALSVCAGCVLWLPLSSLVVRTTIALFASLATLAYSHYRAHTGVTQRNDQATAATVHNSVHNSPRSQIQSPRSGVGVTSSRPALPVSVGAAS